MYTPIIFFMCTALLAASVRAAFSHSRFHLLASFTSINVILGGTLRFFLFRPQNLHLHQMEQRSTGWATLYD